MPVGKFPFPSKKQRAFGSRVHSSAGVLILQIQEEELRRQELLYPLTCIFDVIYVFCFSFLCRLSNFNIVTFKLSFTSVIKARSVFVVDLSL